MAGLSSFAAVFCWVLGIVVRPSALSVWDLRWSFTAAGRSWYLGACDQETAFWPVCLELLLVSLSLCGMMVLARFAGWSTCLDLLEQLLLLRLLRLLQLLLLSSSLFLSTLA